MILNIKFKFYLRLELFASFTNSILGGNFGFALICGLMQFYIASRYLCLILCDVYFLGSRYLCYLPSGKSGESWDAKIPSPPERIYFSGLSCFKEYSGYHPRNPSAVVTYKSHPGATSFLIG